MIEDENAKLVADLYGYRYRIESKWRQRLFDLTARAKHLFGIHTMLMIERWTIENGVRTAGFCGRACWICDEVEGL